MTNQGKLLTKPNITLLCFVKRLPWLINCKNRNILLSQYLNILCKSVKCYEGLCQWFPTGVPRHTRVGRFISEDVWNTHVFPTTNFFSDR